jgi:Putative metallopeptidase
MFEIIAVDMGAEDCSTMRSLFTAIVLVLAIGSSPAWVQEPAAPAPGQIRISYGEPKDPMHRPIYERLQKRRVLEELQEFLSPLKLPKPLTIKLEGCGAVNAYYSNGAVTVCYEYIAWIHQVARKVTLSNEISLEDAVVGPFVDVLLHELAHAIFDLLKIPLFGREEDAADQLAAFILLQFGNDVARRTIVGAALLFRQMAEEQQPGSADYAAVHGLPAQRFYNVLCIAYGAQPQLFADFVKQGFLPVTRIGYCRWEYRQIAHAFRTLISPHVDPVLQEKVRGREWLRADDGRSEGR